MPANVVMGVGWCGTMWESMPIEVLVLRNAKFYREGVVWVNPWSKLRAGKNHVNVLSLWIWGSSLFKLLIVDEDFFRPLNDLNDGLHMNSAKRLQLFLVPSFEL